MGVFQRLRGAALCGTLLWLVWPTVTVPMQLPPEIQADRYLLQAEHAIQERDYIRAKTAMDAIIELQAQHNLELPEQFSFRYAQVLERLGLYDEATEFVTQYLTTAGREGEYYREALELLDSAEEMLRRVEARRRLAEESQRQAEAEQQENAELIRRQVVEANIALARGSLLSGGVAPDMVRIASGRFQYWTLHNGLHWVAFDRPFAISRYEVTRGEFERFVDSTGYRTEARRDPRFGCGSIDDWSGRRNSRRWNSPGFDQTNNHPAVCVSIRDAIAYTEWLSRETGHTYRLPSAAEWQYVARAGSSSAMLGHDVEDVLDVDKDDPTVCRRGNVSDSSADSENIEWFGLVQCSDGATYTTEVGSFQPNEVGVYDMIGNVAELVLACNDRIDHFRRLAPEGSPELPGTCNEYVLATGSSWRRYVSGEAVPVRPRRDTRRGSTYYYKSSSPSVGFRVVRELAD